MPVSLRRDLSLFALVLAFALPSAALSAAPPPLESCEVPGLATPARCATYPVFENREAKSGRTIGLHVVVVPATSGQPTAEAITFFAGGPGDSSTRPAAFFAHQLEPVRAARDLVLVDFRGTGESSPLNCAELAKAGVQGFLDSFLPTEAVRSCRERLERERDLARYTTEEAIDDIAEVLRAYGYTKVNLYGASYGTCAAQVMARRHPELVRSMILEGVVRMNERDPFDFARAAQVALDALFAECAGDPACAAAFPDLPGDLAKVWARLDQAPVTVAVVDPASGEKRPLRIHRQGFAQTIRYMLYVVSTSMALPYQIHAAAQGDFTPIAETAQLFGGMMTANADGFFLSVTCAEDTRLIREEEIVSAVSGTFLGEFRIRQQLAACAAWAARAPDPAFVAPLESAIPTLLLSGERDPVTPASNGESVARHLTNGRHLVIADGAHGSDGMSGLDCLSQISNAFIAAGAIDALDTSCVANMARPPFVLAGAGPTVTLSAAELAALAGRFRHAEAGLELTIEVSGEGLRMSLPGQPPLALRALSAEKFEPVGLPPGYALVFERDAAGRAVALSFLEPSAPPMRLERVE
jgi:pimeloyl-ACP methyl ester carboxylesterase